MLRLRRGCRAGHGNRPPHQLDPTRARAAPFSLKFMIEKTENVTFKRIHFEKY